MIFRYVDRPVQMFKDQMGSLDKEFNPGYLWQFKADGWCTQIVRDKSQRLIEPWGRKDWGKGKDGSLFFLSRRDMVKGGPTKMPVADDMVQAVEALDLPDQTALAGEWMERRTIGEMSGMILLFDVLWWDDQWQGDTRLDKRVSRLATIKPVKGVFEVMPSGSQDFDATFDMIAKDPQYAWTEGLVIKQLGSKLKGDPKKGVDNALHIKIKWRAGYSGREEIP